MEYFAEDVPFCWDARSNKSDLHHFVLLGANLPVCLHIIFIRHLLSIRLFQHNISKTMLLFHVFHTARSHKMMPHQDRHSDLGYKF